MHSCCGGSEVSTEAFERRRREPNVREENTLREAGKSAVRVEVGQVAITCRLIGGSVGGGAEEKE